MLTVNEEPENERRRPRLDTRVIPHIRILNVSLNESEDSSSSIVAQGQIDPGTLRFLKVDDYQRKLEPRDDIWQALRDRITLPSIDIAVRGLDFELDGNDIVIRSPAYITDGWQRVGNAMRLVETIPDHPIRLFALVHFGSTYAWEADRFTNLNKNIRKISPNMHLRNEREKKDAVGALYNLTFSSPEFALYKKVCWAQNMARGDLISALVLAKTAMMLHSHVTSMQAGHTDSIVTAISNAANIVSGPIFKRNIVTFFNLINECWPINNIVYRHGAAQIKSSFLNELARMFSRHSVFWDGPSGGVLVVGADDRRKLAKFPINDDQVTKLAGSGGAARKILYQLLVDHMNSGRRTQRLAER